MKPVVFRKATSMDIKIVYLIRNNPEVRKQLIDDGDINYLNHINHYNDMLLNRNYTIYVMEYGNWIVGYYNIIVNREKREVEIGFKMSPTFQGKGFGKLMFQEAMKTVGKLFPKYNIIMTVFKDNSVAIKIYKNGGFKVVGVKKVREKLLYTMKYIT